MLQPERLAYETAPKPMRAAAQPFGKRFHDDFDTLVYFSGETFHALHQWTLDPAELPPEVVVASTKNSSILSDIEALKKFANAPSMSQADRANYYGRLVTIYAKLPRKPRDVAARPDTLCVGIEREGRILAQGMNCLPLNRSLTPHAKRIPYEDGLVVGLCKARPPAGTFARCLIIDGAIASGATLCAIINELKGVAPHFEVFSVHGPCEGLRGIVRFCHQIGAQVSITVGHATVGMNKKFYAVDPADPKLVILGDVGDTIFKIKTVS
jgi:hypothetical protein